MRKYLIAALAAITAFAFVGVALGQEEAATMTTKLKPKNAGTKKHPTNSKLKLSITNNDVHKTLAKLVIRLPKTVRLDARGLKKCNEARLESDGPAACPRGSKVGGGFADAALGVDQDQPVPLHFDVTAFVVGKKAVDFYLASASPPINVPARGRIRNHGHKLVVTVPDQAQQPAPGVYAGLVTLSTTIGKKSGKHKLLASTGCRHHKHRFRATLDFAANPARPASTATTSSTSKCTK